ncbi:MAG: arsenate reductase family protein [Bdellovibrionaceae bacterium]|nr:arsenate reductase family protein [Pseudobdellovibrionaceae bacterium]
MYKMFGIPNCNTVKNARTYLEERKIQFEFVDLKKYKPTDADIKLWTEKFGGLPVNKSGLTYRKYKEAYEVLSPKEKVKFIQDNTSMIKRPILVKNSAILAFGFSEDSYKELF